MVSKRIRYWQKAIFLGILTLSFVPLPIWADSGPAHRVDEPFPIQLGTSGGNIKDISKGFCYGGTLGALVKDASGNQYILSNNHVLARTNVAALGENIIQPGLIDQSPGSFIAAGDSGSLMVENVDTDPRAVGLLFAGGSTTAIANSIGDVLDAFHVSMVGTGPDPSLSLLGKILAWAKKFSGVTETQA